MIKKGYIKWFSETGLNSKNSIGEKAAYLSEAHNKKILTKNVEIPEGFVITKDAIMHFLKESGIENAIQNIFEEIDYKNSEELKNGISKAKQLIIRTNLQQEISDEIFDSYENLGVNKLEIESGSAYDILSNAQEPIFVAVRGSLKEAESYFNIKGNSSIINAIKKVLTSLFTEKNLIKNHKEKINFELLYTPILIQKMVQSDKSGIFFTNDKYKAKAIWGFGSGLKQTEIGKDTYTIRRDARILDKNIAEKKYAITRDSGGFLKGVQLKDAYSFSQVLTEHEIQDLSDIALRLEDIFKEKLQFDFAIEDDIIYIVKIEKLSQISDVKIQTSEKKITEEITEEIQKSEEKLPISNIKTQNSNNLTISPIKNLTKTKIELLIKTKIESEKGYKTLIKTAFLPIEKIIEMRGIHPKTYIENFNIKEYGEIIESGLRENSKNIEEVWIRLSDFTTEEFKELEGAQEEKEDNPLMGLCGIRFLLSNPELLKRELKAIGKLKENGKSIGVLIPKISSVYELKKVKEFLKELNIKIKVGIILETPASMQLIKDFIEEGIDAAFFSGDGLTQYLLAIDKNNKDVKDFYDDTNPALMYQLEYVIRVCKRKNVKTVFFGQATKKKEMIEYLVKKGIQSIISAPEDANRIEEEIKNAESKFINRTDEEPRKYEISKEKDRQQKELKEFEKIKEEQAKKEAESYSNKNKLIINDTDKAIELIEEEKEKFENSLKKEEKKNLQVIGTHHSTPEPQLAIEEPTTNYEPTINPAMGLPEKPEKMPANVEEAMKIIEKHNNAKPEETETEKAMIEIEKHNQSIGTKHQTSNKINDIPEEEIETLEEGIKYENKTIKLIEEEKQEYLDQKSKNNFSYENENKNKELIEEEIIETSKEDFGEITKNKIEDEEKPEFKKNEKDPLGIF